MSYYADYSLNGKQKEGLDEEVRSVLSEYFDNMDVDGDGIFASGNWSRAYPDVEKGLFEKLIPLVQGFKVEVLGEDGSWGYEYKEGDGLHTFELHLVEVKRRPTTLEEMFIP